ncbi:MAG: hypothetical protein RI956_291 [Pseudomonadota bacterium]|jgi:uncharacterized alpha-E superfamily protein
MLTSTADHLFWMSRYIERTENTVRILSTYLNTYLLTGECTEQKNAYDARVLLQIFGLETNYLSIYTVLNNHYIMLFMVKNIDNFSSIYYTLYQARENARAIRSTLTADLWESINCTWLEFQHKMQHNQWYLELGELFEWLKNRIYLIYGTISNTMPRNESYAFMRVGTAIECAENTAWLLDIQCLEGMMNNQSVNMNADYYRWTAILHSVSAYEIYRKTYHGTIIPVRVAELIMIRTAMPRSLLTSINTLCQYLQSLANNRSDATLRKANLLQAQLSFTTMDIVLQQDLHVYLTEFLSQIRDIAQGINRDFLTNK